MFENLIFVLFLFPVTSEGSIRMEEGEDLWVIETDQGDGWTRVRRIQIASTDPMPEGFVPSTYIEITEMFSNPHPVWGVSGNSLIFVAQFFGLFSPKNTFRSFLAWRHFRIRTSGWKEKQKRKFTDSWMFCKCCHFCFWHNLRKKISFNSTFYVFGKSYNFTFRIQFCQVKNTLLKQFWFLCVSAIK